MSKHGLWSYTRPMQTVVGILRGGPSREHEVSLATGAAMLGALPPERFTARDIYIDRAGVWHDRGRAAAPERVLRQLDLALVALHGEYGEDGEVQKLLERFGVPYAGADSFASFRAMHKVFAKEAAREAGILTPEYRFIQENSNIEEAALDITRSFHQPVVVKPVGWGSSIGISVVGGYAPVRAAVAKLFSDGAAGVVVEELMRGREATVGVVEGLRGEALYALPAVEIVSPDGDFYSYDAKYSGATRHECPGRFSRVETEELARAARLMHRVLGLRHYSRSNFIVSPKGIYYLETNTLPGLTKESNLPIALAAVGVPLSDFLSHLVNLALAR